MRVDLPPPDTPVMAVKVPRGNLDRHVLQVVAAGADHLQRPPLLRFAALRRDLHLQFAFEILAGERVGVSHHLVGRSLGDDLAAVDSGAGTDVEYVIRLQDRVFVVLHDDHRVAEVAQALQRSEQAFVVALMQADRGLVEHVENAREP